MDKLEMKHLAPYLSYGLQVNLEGKVKELVGLEAPYKTNSNYYIRGELREIGGTYRNTQSMCLTKDNYHLCKPLLLPLSELKDHPNWTHCSSYEAFIAEIKMGTVRYNKFNSLCKDHFDVFGLIEKGLALNINTING